MQRVFSSDSNVVVAVNAKLYGINADGDLVEVDMVGGAAKVSVDLGLEAFKDLGLIITPVAGVSIPFLTVPAGCYTVSLNPVKTAGSVLIALTLPCAININADAVASTSYVLDPADDELRISVNPGDIIEVTGDTGSLGSVRAYFLG